MPEFLVLLKLNPMQIIDALSAIRNLEQKPIPGVDLLYSINIFGSWDAGVWINANENAQALDFIQKKIKTLGGVTETYSIPTFPHGNGV